MNDIKHFWQFVTSVVFGYIGSIVAPVSHNLTALMILLLINFFFGWIAGMVKGESFSFDKACKAISHAAVFVFFIIAIYWFCDRMGDLSGGIKVISITMYTILYFVGTNVLRNLNIIFKEDTPPGKVFRFFYFVLTYEFIKKIPHLQDYINSEKSKKDEDNKQF